MNTRTISLLAAGVFAAMILSPVSAASDIKPVHTELSGTELTGTESEVSLEPWTYSENFETREPGAWASYPHWLDIAYDPNFRVNELVPGDSNISLVQKVEPYTSLYPNEGGTPDSYAGAQKLLDMYLVPGSEIRFRYYIKTHQPAAFFTVRLAGGDYGKIDVSLPEPETNRWVRVTLDYNDIVRENPDLRGLEQIRIHALAFLTKISEADPDMPFYLGLDDITLRGARETAFRFGEPVMHKLPEFSPYIPANHYRTGDNFVIDGRWPVGAERVAVDIASYTDENERVFEGELVRQGDRWVLPPLTLNFPEGLYSGRLTAHHGQKQLAETEFTLHIAPDNLGGEHPRLLFDENRKEMINERFRQERFRTAREEIRANMDSVTYRGWTSTKEELTPESLVYDLDQFPDEDWIPTWGAWGSRIYITGDAIRWNARAYAHLGDREAGEYAKDLLVALAGWPNWTHPWQTKRGRFSEHRTGFWAHCLAEGYDLTYDLMSPDERTAVRKALLKNIIGGAHRTYVHNNEATGQTSNWLGILVGGSLTNMAAIFGDGPETENLEPYFTGAMIKFYEFINRVTDSEDGAWGEGLGYNGYSFANMSYSVPALKNVFNIDVTAPLAGTYNEFIWAGLVKDNRWFEYGDSHPYLVFHTPYPDQQTIHPHWAFLLEMRKEPRLGWFYNYMKTPKDRSGQVNLAENREAERLETYMDVVYETGRVPREDPFGENPVKLFREAGTTVFKSGWEADDFVFTMRAGPFYNHQHAAHGTFWLADRGVIFIEQRRVSKQTIGASTVLIDGNHQSQRSGDHQYFAPGFHDHASTGHFLDGRDAAWSSADIGKLYWDKVKSLHRNVLYLKPDVLLMLDTVVPAGAKRDVTLQYQTSRLDGIRTGGKASSITKEGASLHIMHLAPDHVEAKAVETPHRSGTLRSERSLVKPGMLTLTARAENNPLVMANLLTTSSEGEMPDVDSKPGTGHVAGTLKGSDFAFSTHPGRLYEVEDMSTDALALTWSGDRIFAAEATVLRRAGKLVLKSGSPVTFEYSPDGSITYYRETGGPLTVGAASPPESVSHNGAASDFTYDSLEKSFTLEVSAGEGTVTVQ
ncbi:MAG: hypothetical protein WD317_03625 [Balneolaceae bacterium]